MKHFNVEFAENPNGITPTELTGFIFLTAIEAETAQAAAIQAAEIKGREKIAYRVTELSEDGTTGAETHVIDFISAAKG